MTEKLFTGTLNHNKNKNKQNRQCSVRIALMLNLICVFVVCVITNGMDMVRLFHDTAQIMIINFMTIHLISFVWQKVRTSCYVYKNFH